jgi:hypothetical protein
MFTLALARHCADPLGNYLCPLLLVAFDSSPNTIPLGKKKVQVKINPCLILGQPVPAFVAIVGVVVDNLGTNLVCALADNHN